MHFAFSFITRIDSSFITALVNQIKKSFIDYRINYYFMAYKLTIIMEILLINP